MAHQIEPDMAMVPEGEEPTEETPTLCLKCFVENPVPESECPADASEA